MVIISNVFTSRSRPQVQLVSVITYRNFSTMMITHLYFWRLWVSLSYRVYFAQWTMCLPSSMELVGALCGHCTKRTQRSLQKKKNSNNNEQSACKGNEIMTEAYNDGKNRCGSRKFRKEWLNHLPTCPLVSYIDTFYFSWNFYKNNRKPSKKKGLLRPPRSTPKLNNMQSG